MSSATISPCGLYRYNLCRYIPDGPVDARSCLFVMLNPSTADASLDDPTIRRCIGFARREGCARMTVVNLFALRSADPWLLLSAEDPVGPDNMATITREIRYHMTAGLVVCAWGAHPGSLSTRAYDTIDWIKATGAPLKCLGKTKSGAPRHPLYVKSDQPLEPWP